MSPCIVIGPTENSKTTEFNLIFLAEYILVLVLRAFWFVFDQWFIFLGGQQFNDVEQVVAAQFFAFSENFAPKKWYQYEI